MVGRSPLTCSSYPYSMLFATRYHAVVSSVLEYISPRLKHNRRLAPITVSLLSEKSINLYILKVIWTLGSERSFKALSVNAVRSSLSGIYFPNLLTATGIALNARATTSEADLRDGLWSIINLRGMLETFTPITVIKRPLYNFNVNKPGRLEKGCEMLGPSIETNQTVVIMEQVQVLHKLD